MIIEKLKSVKKLDSFISKRYDLQTKTSNFFANSILVHNSSGTYFIKKNTKKWQFWKPYLFGVCSRNWQLIKEDNSSYWTVARKYNFKNKMITLVKKNCVDTLVIQGEIIGPGIQKNKYHLTEYTFFLFNLFSGKGKNKFSYEQIVQNSVALEMGIYTVPVLDLQFKLLSSIPEMVNLAKGQSMLYNTEREGVVIRNYLKNISFKVINPEFLLKENFY